MTLAGRRGRLAGALVAAAALAVVPVAGCSAPVNTQGAQVLHLTVDSRFVHGAMPLTLVTPAGGGAHRPLLVFLHGVVYDNNSQLTNQMFAALRALGPRAPDIAFPYGDGSYWHNRASGAWASYVLDEVIPTALKILDADPRRVAIGGISMGGFGAYDIARLAPGRFCAVGGDSAALWDTFGGAALGSPGSFDDAADFARDNVIAAAQANPDLYGHAQLWLDGGSADPFHTADEELASALRIPLHVWPGGHDFGYWDAHWNDYLAFYAHAFATCG